MMPPRDTLVPIGTPSSTAAGVHYDHALVKLGQPAKGILQLEGYVNVSQIKSIEICSIQRYRQLDPAQLFQIVRRILAL